MDLPPRLAIPPDHPRERLSGTDQGASDLVDLVSRAKAGDRAAYTVLYHRYLDAVYRFCLVRLESREAAEDATQTIFVRALIALPSCREHAAFVGWLFTIARNVVTDHLRARRYPSDPIPDEPLWADPAPGPEEVLLQGETTRFLLAARERCLSARDRELFDLLLTELNDKEIAQTLGRTHGAVRVAHVRLLHKLRNCLRPLSRQTTGPLHA
jgi:RNA polymerase sigma-70 factor (ECF subfamily)